MIANKRMFAALFALWSATALTPLAASAQQAAQNPRIALVVGNATYKDKALATTANDAGLVAQTLQAAGFEVVGARDLDEKSLRTALRDFLDKAAAAGPDMQAFVYLSGRGLQYDGDNFFVPVDAQINRAADAPIESLRISDFTHALAAIPGRARIVVLDAARANSYVGQGAPLAPGFALIDPEPGELIAYNAAPGTLAGDEQGPYGVYGKTLAGAMRQGGVGIEDVFNQTRVAVNQLTKGALIPWSASKLGAPYYIFERAADAPPLPPADLGQSKKPIASFSQEEAYSAALQRDTMAGYQEYLAAYPSADQARRVRAILAARREAAFWRRSVNANNPHSYWTYLQRYPKGPHVADARRRLAFLSARYEPPADFEPVIYDDLPPPPPEERFYLDRPYYAFDDFGPPPPVGYYYYSEDDDWRDLPPPPPPREIGVLPVLGIAIPLVIGAIAFREHFHRDGVAPVGTAPPPPPLFTPPPLPPNIKPVRPPEPIPIAAPATGSGAVKPLPPIASAPPAAAGKAPVATPPVAPVAGTPPIGAPVAPAPGGKLPVVLAPLVGGKLPTPPPAAPAQGAPPSGAPAAPVLGGKLPTPPAAAPAVGIKLAPKAPAPLPLPTPTPTPGALVKPPVVVAPLAPVKTPAAPIAATPAPVVHAPPAPALAPVIHVAPAPAPALHAPALAPVIHVAPAPAPVLHAPAPAPVIQVAPAPAPVVHAPPPAPAPAIHVAPQAPAPLVHAPPAPVGKPPLCGKPGLPPCP